jgi:hypothetical protein
VISDGGDSSFPHFGSSPSSRWVSVLLRFFYRESCDMLHEGGVQVMRAYDRCWNKRGEIKKIVLK